MMEWKEKLMGVAFTDFGGCLRVVGEHKVPEIVRVAVKEAATAIAKERIRRFSTGDAEADALQVKGMVDEFMVWWDKEAQ